MSKCLLDEWRTYNWDLSLIDYRIFRRAILRECTELRVLSIRYLLIIFHCSISLSLSLSMYYARLKTRSRLRAA